MGAAVFRAGSSQPALSASCHGLLGSAGSKCCASARNVCVQLGRPWEVSQSCVSLLWNCQSYPRQIASRGRR